MIEENEVMHHSSTRAHEDHSTNPTSKNDDGCGNSKGMMMIVYKECLKNHAAAIGAHSTDGCGEFMPSNGEEDALLCSACGCHRNFHRKEVDMGGPSHAYYLPKCHYGCINTSNVSGKELLECKQEYEEGALGHGLHNTRGEDVGPMATPSGINGEKVKAEEATTTRNKKKRHRTRFTNEQKEKMLEFAQNVGWRIQKANEGIVQQFCQEIGIKKRILKVWMHNNKHLFVKKINNTFPSDQQHASESTDKKQVRNDSS